MLVLRWGVYGVMLGQLIGVAVGVGMSIGRCRDTLVFAWEQRRFQRMLRFGLPSVPAVAGNWLQAASGQVLVLSLLSLSDLGVYSLALRLASVLSLYQMAFNMAWYPFAMSIINQPDSREKYAIGVLAYVCGAAAIAFPVALLAPDRSDSGRTRFQGTSSVLGIIALAVLGEGMVATASFGIMVTKRTYYYWLSYVISVVVNIVITLSLIKAVGVVAVALGLMAGR